jgi:phenylacetate-CoA ligase
MKKAFSRKNIWESLPDSFKGIIGTALNVIPTDHLIGNKFKRTRNFLLESQWWSKEQIEEYQLLKLKKLLIDSFNNTKFYRKQFEIIGFNPLNFNELSDINALPLIDKDTVNKYCTDMLTVDIHSKKIDYVTTGGTSGIPLNFYATADRSQPEFAYLLSGWERIGYRLGTPMAVFRGRTVRMNSNGLYHSYDPIFKNNFYSNFHLSEENIEKYLDHIKTLGPCYLHVYPSAAYHLAKFIRRSGYISPKNIKGIIAESENVYPDQREFIEQTFNVRFFSSYGHTEKLVAAAECEYSTNYHVWPTYGYFELIDDNGNTVKDKGTIGEIVGTGFINNVMPFIRYRTGDYAEYVGDKCEMCGRNHIIIKDIRGHRTQEVLVGSDGALIPWAAVNMHDDTFDAVSQFQFTQSKKGFATLKIVKTDNFSEANYKRIMNNLASKFQGNLVFSIEIVDKINLTKAGKSIYVDQKIDNL